MRQILMALVLVVSAVPAWAQGQAPNRRDIVEQVTAANPSLFACAHVESCGDAKYDWVKAVAWALYQSDPRFGLNMKRDNDSQGLSMDAITFRRGPGDRDVEVYDICGGCGASGARPAWQDVTNYAQMGQPGSARWVKPSPAGGGGGGNTGGGGGTTPPATPVDLTPVMNAIKAQDAQIAALKATVEALAGALAEAKDAAKSAAWDAREINAWRMMPPAPVTVPCLKGRVPKAPFGGSTEVVFCPVVP